MKPVTVSVDVARSREDVYAFLDVLGNHEAFTDHFLVDWQLEGPPSGVGAAVKMQAKVAGRTEPVELEVKDAEAPRRIVEKTVAAGGKRRTRGTYTLSELGPNRTHIEFELAMEAQPAYEKPLNPVTRAYMRKLNGRAMERLRELLEAGSATA
jgi:Polyketide cyclase / dehydrase and lipid transport